MKYNLTTNVDNDVLAEASRNLGEQIAAARGEVYNQDQHFLEGFTELKRRIEERMKSVEGDVINEAIGNNLALAAE